MAIKAEVNQSESHAKTLYATVKPNMEARAYEPQVLVVHMPQVDDLLLMRSLFRKHSTGKLFQACFALDAECKRQGIY